MGVDNHSDDQATVDFVVLGDGRELWRSGPLKKTDAPTAVEVDLTGVHQLTLRTIGNSDEENRSQADWAEPKVSKAGPLTVTFQHAVHEPPDAQRIGLLQFIWQRRLGEILKTYRAQKAFDGPCADGSGASVRGRGIRPAVGHCVGDFHAGGKTVEDNPARLDCEISTSSRCVFDSSGNP